MRGSVYACIFPARFLSLSVLFPPCCCSQAALWAQVVATASNSTTGTSTGASIAAVHLLEAAIAAARERVIAALTATASADDGGTTTSEHPPAPSAPPDAPVQTFSDISSSFFTAMAKVAAVLSLPSAAESEVVLGARVMDKPTLLSLYGLGGGDLLLEDPAIAAAAAASLQAAVTAAESLRPPPPPPPPPPAAGGQPSAPGAAGGSSGSPVGAGGTPVSSGGGGSGGAPGVSDPTGATGGGGDRGTTGTGTGTGVNEIGSYSPSPSLQTDGGSGTSGGAFSPSANAGSAPRQVGGNGADGGADGSTGSNGTGNGTSSSSGSGGSSTAGASNGSGSSGGGSSIHLAVLVPAVVGGILLVALAAAAFGYAAAVQRRPRRHSAGGADAARGHGDAAVAASGSAAVAASSWRRRLGEGGPQVASSGGSWAFRLRQGGEDYEVASRASTIVFENLMAVALVLDDLEEPTHVSGTVAVGGAGAVTALGGSGWVAGGRNRGTHDHQPPPSPPPPLMVPDERDEDAMSQHMPELASGAATPLAVAGSRSTSPQRWALMAAAAAATAAANPAGSTATAADAAIAAGSLRDGRLCLTPRASSLRAAAPPLSRCGSAFNLHECVRAEDPAERLMRTAGSPPLSCRTLAALDKGTAAGGSHGVSLLRIGGNVAVTTPGEEASGAAAAGVAGVGTASTPGATPGVLAAALGLLRRQGFAAAVASATVNAAGVDAERSRVLSRGGSFSVVSRKNSVVAVAPEPTPADAASAATAAGASGTATALSIGAAATAAASAMAAARRRGGLPDLATVLSSGVMLAAPPSSPTAAGISGSFGGGRTSPFSHGPGSARSRLGQHSRSTIVPFMAEYGTAGGPPPPIVAAPVVGSSRAQFISGPGISSGAPPPAQPLPPPRTSDGPPSAGLDGGVASRQRPSRFMPDSRATSAGGVTPVTLATTTAATSRRSSTGGAVVCGAAGAASPPQGESLRTTPASARLRDAVVVEGEPFEMADNGAGAVGAQAVLQPAAAAAQAAAAGPAMSAKAAAVAVAKAPSLVGRFVAWARGLFGKASSPSPPTTAAVTPEPMSPPQSAAAADSRVVGSEVAEPVTPFAHASTVAASAAGTAGVGAPEGSETAAVSSSPAPAAAARRSSAPGGADSVSHALSPPQHSEHVQPGAQPGAHPAPGAAEYPATSTPAQHLSMAEVWDAASPAPKELKLCGDAAPPPAAAAAATQAACGAGLGPSISAPSEVLHGRGADAQASDSTQPQALAAPAISAPQPSAATGADAGTAGMSTNAAGIPLTPAAPSASLPLPAAALALVESHPHGLPPKAPASPAAAGPLLSPAHQAPGSLPPLSRGRHTYKPRRLPPIEAAAPAAAAAATTQTESSGLLGAGTCESVPAAPAGATAQASSKAARAEMPQAGDMSCASQPSSPPASPTRATPGAPVSMPCGGDAGSLMSEAAELQPDSGAESVQAPQPEPSHPPSVSGGATAQVQLLQILAAQQQQLSAAVASHALLPPSPLLLPSSQQQSGAGLPSPASVQLQPQQPHSSRPQSAAQQDPASPRVRALASALSIARRDRRGLLNPLQLPNDPRAGAEGEGDATATAAETMAALQARSVSARRLAPVVSFRRASITDAASIFPAAAASDAAAAAAAAAAPGSSRHRVGGVQRDFGSQSSVGSGTGSHVQDDADNDDACEWDDDWGAGGSVIEAGGRVSARLKSSTRFGAASTSRTRLHPLASATSGLEAPPPRGVSPAAALLASRSFTAAAAAAAAAAGVAASSPRGQLRFHMPGALQPAAADGSEPVSPKPQPSSAVLPTSQTEARSGAAVGTSSMPEPTEAGVAAAVGKPETGTVVAAVGPITPEIMRPDALLAWSSDPHAVASAVDAPAPREVVDGEQLGEWHGAGAGVAADAVQHNATHARRRLALEDAASPPPIVDTVAVPPLTAAVEAASAAIADGLDPEQPMPPRLQQLRGRAGLQELGAGQEQERQHGARSYHQAGTAPAAEAVHPAPPPAPPSLPPPVSQQLPPAGLQPLKRARPQALEPEPEPEAVPAAEAHLELQLEMPAPDSAAPEPSSADEIESDAAGGVAVGSRGPGLNVPTEGSNTFRAEGGTGVQPLEQHEQHEEFLGMEPEPEPQRHMITRAEKAAKLAERAERVAKREAKAAAKMAREERKRQLAVAADAARSLPSASMGGY